MVTTTPIDTLLGGIRVASVGLAWAVARIAHQKDAGADPWKGFD